MWNGGSESVEVEAGSTTIYLTPRQYMLIYRLEEPENFIGDPKALEGSVGFRVGAGSAYSVSLPGYGELLGGLIVSTGSPVALTILWPGGEWNTTLGPGTHTLRNIAPGQYTIIYRLEEPPGGLIGDPGVLEGVSTVTVEPSDLAGLEIPGYGELLGRLVVEAPEDARVLIEWAGGSAEYRGGVSLWAAPGLYSVVVDGNGWSNSSSVEVVAGGEARLTLKPPPLVPPGPATPSTTTTTTTGTGATGQTSTPTQTTTTTATTTTRAGATGTGEAREPTTPGPIDATTAVPSTTTTTGTGATDTGEDAGQEAPATPSTEEPTQAATWEDTAGGLAGVSSLGLPLLAVAGAGMAYLVLRRRGEARQPPLVTGLEGLEGVVGRPLARLAPGPGCGGPVFEARLDRHVAPEGFEGEWSCCPLGCGGWGCAYKCTRNGETVVFKMPRGFEDLLKGGVPTVGERLLGRVVREASSVAVLRHPHVLRLLAYSKTAPLLVYEYGDGGSLEHQLDSGWQPTLADVALLGTQLGDALRYIHSRGMVHGDVKPENVFLVSGVAKLGDFSSLVRLAAMTTSRSLAYTPGWRAPEQVYSDLRRRSAEMGLENRVDVYQLGNLLLYLLTGEHIDGEEAAAGQERLREALAGVVDRELRELLGMMLALEPWSRPGMEEVVSRLLDVLRRLED